VLRTIAVMMRSNLTLLATPYLQGDLRSSIPDLGLLQSSRPNNQRVINSEPAAFQLYQTLLANSTTANAPFFKSQNNTTPGREWVHSFSRDG